MRRSESGSSHVGEKLLKKKKIGAHLLDGCSVESVKV